MSNNDIPVKKIVSIVGLVALLGFGSCFVGNMFETVGAGSIVVKQGVADGKLTVWSQPGLQWQGWGRLSFYKRSDQYSFGGKDDTADPAVKVRFNDFGQAHVSGSLRYDLPTDEEQVKRLHMTYGSQEAVERQLIGKAVTNAVYMTGPLMSSTDAASAKRADLLSLAEDQLRFGIYKQKHRDERTKDPITQQEKTVKVVELAPCTQGALCIGGFERQDRSPLDEFGIKIYALTYSGIEFEETVQKQISRQQEATAAVQEAMAHARKAEQAALTAQKEGEAAIAKTRAEQEVEKTKAVVAAEKEKEVALLKAAQQREVAEQDAKAALAEKQANILRGQGESERARLNQSANNSLEQRLDAYVKVQSAWAEALKGSQLVPSVVMGGASGNHGATDLMTLLSLQAARDLGVSLQTARSGK